MIQVGDIIRVKGSDPELDDCDVGICTYHKYDVLYVMWSDGSCGQADINDWEPTGQHTNFVDSLLLRVNELIGKKKILKEGD